MTNSDFILIAPIKIKSIISLKIVQKFNEHASAYLEAILDENEKNENIYSINENMPFTIKNKKTNDNNIVFIGIPVKVIFSAENEIRKVHIHIKSASIKGDILKKSRSFQNHSNTFDNIFEKIISEEYKGDIININYTADKQQSCVIQYEETDWLFLIRLASKLKTVILPDINSARVKIWIGLPKGTNYIDEFHNKKISKNIDDFLYHHLKKAQKSELEFTQFTVNSMYNYEMGDNITCEDTLFKIVEKISEFEKGYMVYTYKLCKETGIFSGTHYNTALQGLSIDGKVLAVKEDQLKLHLAIDKKQDEADCCWFRVNTPYSTEGSTGMYCMPKKDDNVKLYFPTEDEADAFVKIITRTDGKENADTQNPENKYWKTNSEMQLAMLPNQLSFTALSEDISINMSNSMGIDIQGVPDINLNGGKLLRLEADSIHFNPGENMIIATSKANIIIDEIMHFKA